MRNKKKAFCNQWQMSMKLSDLLIFDEMRVEHFPVSDLQKFPSLEQILAAVCYKLMYVSAWNDREMEKAFRSFHITLSCSSSSLAIRLLWIIDLDSQRNRDI
ncbi:hypothetical protein RchiOBHm_Chr4g0429411 [Rosa chinensis]|uniref:Uncharacterized protein n=1 Tax=Rosa chinensis TaxID=74649 RepID=A0A2P6R060_ROSCH|nr:hypothetical protein RchiOBHm_Chr4g0429411 [Rosa chinensis]